MFATWILCLFLLMIAPYLTLEAGILRKNCLLYTSDAADEL